MPIWKTATACAAPALLAAWALAGAGAATAQQAPTMRDGPADQAEQRGSEPDDGAGPAAEGDIDLLVPDWESGPPAAPHDEEEEALRATLRPTIGPYEPLGIRVGGFLLLPEIESGTIHSDNVFLTATERRSDTAWYYAPRLEFRSNWSRHELSGHARALRSHYRQFSSEDDRTHELLLRGRIDVTRRAQLEAEALHGREQESRDRIGVPADVPRRADVTTRAGALQGSHRFNRLTLRLRGRVTEESYSDLDFPGDGPIAGADRDNVVHAAIGRASYEFQPGVSAFVEAGANERRFRRRFDDRGVSRGSTGWMAQGGVTVRLTGKLEGEASAGYLRQTPNDPDAAVIQGPIFNAGLAWQPSALTTVRLSAETELDETSPVAASGSLLRTYRLAVEHALRRNIMLGAGLAHSTETFAESDDEVRTWEARLTAEYLLNRNLALRGEYAHRRERASELTEGFVENRLRLGLALRR